MANTKKYVSLDKLGLYDEKIKKVISDGDAASLQSAKDYAKDYADGLATNYDAAGAAATVQGKLDEEVLRAKAAEEANAAAAKQAQDEVDALELVVANKAAQSDLDALAGKVGEVPEGSTVMGIIENIQENAYDDTALRTEMATELGKKADKTQVATDIADAVKAEEDARKEAVAGVQDAVDTLAETHATDKAALEGAVALKADKTALDAVSEVANAAVKQADYDVKVKALEDEDARIVGLVEAEAEAARAAEEALGGRLEDVEAFFKLAEGEQLDEALDTLKELQDFVNGEGAAADQMILDIAANAKAIEDHIATDHDFAAADDALEEALMAEIAKKADKTTVEGIDGRLVTAEGKITTLEGEMDAVEGAVATKVEQEAYNTKVAALEDADEAQVERIAALEAKFNEGEGSVEDMIADAVAAEKAEREAADAEIQADANQGIADAADALAAAQAADAKAVAAQGEVDALEGVVATKAAQADLEALAGRVTVNEGDIATLKTDVDAVEALAAANDAAIKALQTASANYALKTEVEAVSNRVTTLETWHNNFTEASEAEINALFA